MSEETDKTEQRTLGVWACQFCYYDQDGNIVGDIDGNPLLYEAPNMDCTYISDEMSEAELVPIVQAPEIDRDSFKNIALPLLEQVMDLDEAAELTCQIADELGLEGEEEEEDQLIAIAKTEVVVERNYMLKLSNLLEFLNCQREAQECKDIAVYGEIYTQEDQEEKQNETP